MLVDALERTVKTLSQLDKKEAAIQNAEKKAQNDKDFSTLTADFYASMCKLKYAHSELGYKLSEDTLQLAEDSLSKLQETIDAGVVDEEKLTSARKQINRKLNPGFSREWKDFHVKKTKSVDGKLATVGSLASDDTRVETLRSNIIESGDWSTLSELVGVGTTKLASFKTSIDEVDKIEEGLNLNDEVKQFIALVSRGRAKITDLSDGIMSWIKEENLADKFSIRFK